MTLPAPLSVRTPAQRVGGSARRRPVTASIGAPGYLPALVRRTVAEPGRGLAEPVRAELEPLFDRDFSHVQVHSGPSAERSCELLRARAYTVGSHVVLPGSADSSGSARSGPGQRLLAHEIAHVLQQEHRSHSGPIGAFAGAPAQAAEYEAERAAATVAAGRRVDPVRERGIGPARAPRSLELSLNPATLSHTELEAEINEIESYLSAHPVSSADNDHLIEEQSRLRAELKQRNKQESSGRTTRKRSSAPVAGASVVPRSLTESLLVDDTMPELELLREINAIHDFLRVGARKADRLMLTEALSKLEAEKGRRDQQAAVKERAEKIQQAFAPRGGESEGDALITVMRTVDGIRPSQSSPGNFVIVRDGQVLLITAEEHSRIRAGAVKSMQDGLVKIARRADDAEAQYAAQHQINSDQYIVSGAVHLFGGIKDPGEAVTQDVRTARINAKTARVFIDRGELARAAEFFSTSERYAGAAKQLSSAYVRDLISTAETTVTVLEVTRDVAFAATLAIGAVVAAPIVAGGVLATGATGLTATALTIGGTGLVVGTGGAVLRGGTAAAGVGLAGGTAGQAWQAGKSEGWRGFKEGVVSGVGGAAGRAAGTALKVGQSTSRVVNVARAAVAEGVGNAAGGATSSALEGKGAGEIGTSALTSFAVGTVTSPLGQAAGSIKGPVGGALARTATAATITGGVTYAQTGDRDLAIRSGGLAAANALILSVPTSARPADTHSTFGELGAELRAEVPEGQGPVLGQKLGSLDPAGASGASGASGGAGGSPAPGGPSPAAGSPAAAVAARYRRTPAQRIQDEAPMAAARLQEGLDSLADLPDLQNAVAASNRRYGGQAQLRDLAADSPSELRDMWGRWQANRAAALAANKQPTSFEDYVGKVQSSQYRGRHGELTDAFTRGSHEILVAAPGGVNESGIDSVSYAPASGRIKVLDNKALKTGSSVSKVTALQQNLPSQGPVGARTKVGNLAEVIGQVQAVAAQPGVPPEIGQIVLPRLRAAEAAIDSHVAQWQQANPGAALDDRALQADIGRILDQHGIDRVVTTAGGGSNVRISRELGTNQGFSQE
ncbi:DUF4157 domain-containing protein [Jatrophihabitans telluris]|uniref:DUF4157 domain-containing protein n=1 Tax=Jatrophihabitans telluris TaxID=2038343 RepID=A0ABY4QWS5_9ACTN|nr:DUF4157 domain-containing protein [Jatrophihabitans telluris]UQX88121.1 DUF4157 domain-containing protein [Jatrophihabitans telluris]